MNLGAKIKELRQKHNMTQDQLAARIGVSYQAVSKWETGVTCPDLSMILPLSRLFQVTTDELFGVEGENGRRAEFDAAYENYWQKDLDDMYQMAKQAVAEFPGDDKYLCWLASMEYYVAFDEDYCNGGSTDFFCAMLEQARTHYAMVLESCAQEEIRQNALFGIILTLKYLNRPEEAQAYAQLAPEEQNKNRDMFLAECTTGEEHLAVCQRLVYRKTQDLLYALGHLWRFHDTSIYARRAMDVSKQLILLLLEGKEAYRFHGYLYELELRAAEISIEDQDPDGAIAHLRASKELAQKLDAYHKNGAITYTCTLLDHVQDDLSCPLLPDDSMNCWNDNIQKPIFDPLRDRKDFQELLISRDF